jgi:hypothetical protein
MCNVKNCDSALSNVVEDTEKWLYILRPIQSSASNKSSQVIHHKESHSLLHKSISYYQPSLTLAVYIQVIEMRVVAR